MTSIDKRTRFVGDTEPLDASWLFDELPAILRDSGGLGARGVELLGLTTFGLDVEGTAAHIVVDHDRLVVREGDAESGPIAILDDAAYSDLMQDLSTSTPCSPRPRWRPCRPSSATRLPRPRTTTARRGGPGTTTAGSRRASSAST